MNGKRSKILRRIIYNDLYSGSHDRKYIQLENGQIVSQKIRRAYQEAKKHLKISYGLKLWQLHLGDEQKSKLSVKNL